MAGKKRDSKTKTNRKGETVVASNGELMEIIEYRRCDDIDVMFSDGTIVYNKQYTKFKMGQIKNPNNPNSINNHRHSSAKRKRNQKHIGESVIAKNGMKVTITYFVHTGNINVKFEDGTLVKGITYDQFLKGYIKYPGELRIGEKNIANNGMEIEIVAYRAAHDIDVKFSDGEIVTNKTYQLFLNGEIQHPKLNTKTLLNAKKHIGKTKIANNGQLMTIIAYRRHNDIDIIFEEGTVVYHKCYSCFKNGSIYNPNQNKQNTRHPISNDMAAIRMEEKSATKEGITAKIVAYKNCTDIDILTTDGILVKGIAYQQFKKGEFKKAVMKAKNIQEQ